MKTKKTSPKYTQENIKQHLNVLNWTWKENKQITRTKKMGGESIPNIQWVKSILIAIHAFRWSSKKYDTHKILSHKKIKWAKKYKSRKFERERVLAVVHHHYPKPSGFVPFISL